MRFTNDLYDPATNTDRNLLVDWLGVTALAPVTGPAEPHPRVCTPARARDEEPSARQMVERLARRAWRRPVTDAELTELMGVYTLVRASGDGFELP